MLVYTSTFVSDLARHRTRQRQIVRCVVYYLRSDSCHLLDRVFYMCIHDMCMCMCMLCMCMLMYIVQRALSWAQLDEIT